MPESEGAVPLGHLFPGPRAVRVIQRSPLGTGGELGKCAGRGQAGPLTLPQEVPQGRRGGRGLVPGSEPPNHDRGLLLALRLLCCDPRLFFHQCLPYPPPVKATQTISDQKQEKQVSVVLKFTEIILKNPTRKKCLHIISVFTRSSPLRCVTSLATKTHSQPCYLCV